MAAAPRATSTPPEPGSSGSRAASSSGACTQHRPLTSASSSALRARNASPPPSEAGGALAGSSMAEPASAQVDAPGAPFNSALRMQASEQALLRGAAACQYLASSDRGARSGGDGGALAHSQPTPAQYASHVVRGDTPFPGGRHPAQQVQFAASLPGWPEESYYDYSSAAAPHSSYSHASGQYAEPDHSTHLVSVERSSAGTAGCHSSHSAAHACCAHGGCGGYMPLEDVGPVDHATAAQPQDSSASPRCFSCCSWNPCCCCCPQPPQAQVEAPAAPQVQQMEPPQPRVVWDARTQRWRLADQPLPPRPVWDPALNRWFIPEAVQPSPSPPPPPPLPPPPPAAPPAPMPPMPRSMAPPVAPYQNVDPIALVREVALALQERPQPDSLPKSLKTVPDPLHSFSWATTALSNQMLDGYTTSLTAAEVRREVPRVAAALLRAQDACAPPALLAHFLTLSTYEGGVSPVDYAAAHRAVLQRLVAAVGPVPDQIQASSEASKYLLESMRYHAEHTGSDPRFRNAWSSLESRQPPPEPTPLLSVLATSFMPPESFGSSRHAYHEYLANTFDMSDLNSTPSQVLAAAKRIAKEHSPTRSDALNGEEAKLLFGDWVRKLTPAHEAIFSPLNRLLNSISFQRMTVKEWEQQLRIHEQRSGDLYKFVQSLPSVRVGRAQGRPRQPAQIQEIQPFNALPRATHGLTPRIYSVGPPSVVPREASGAAGPDGDGADVNHFAPPHVYAFSGPKTRDPACEPLTEALAAAVNDQSSPFWLKPFQIPTTKMDAAWVQLYGCTDLGPPPNAPRDQKTHLPVEALAKALAVPMPERFYSHGHGKPHVGGDSCFACMFMSYLEGIVLKWYLHPSDVAAPPGAAAKPPGRQHKYVHQVFTCSLALALAHRLVRSDRDAGRGDVNAHVFTAPPRE